MSDPIRVTLFDDTLLEFDYGTPQDVIDKTARAETLRRQVERRKATIASNPGEYDPTSSEFKAKYGATSGNSFADNFNVGVGKVFTDIGLGAQQAVGAAPAGAADEKRRMDAAIMDTAGGNVGYAAGALTVTAPAAMALGASVPGAALAGGLFGAAQPAASVADRYLQAGTGMGYGALGQYGLDKLLGRVGSYLGRPQNATAGLTPEGVPVPASNRIRVPEGFSAPSAATRASYQPSNQQRIAARAEAAGLGAAQASGRSAAGATVSANPNVSVRTQTTPSFGEVGDDVSAGLTSTQGRILKVAESLGFRTTPGVKTGSKALQQQEAKMESQPWSSGPFFAIKNGNQKTGNSIAAKALGAKSDVVDDRVFAQTSDRIGRVYESVADERVRKVAPDKFIEELSAIDQEWDGLLTGGKAVSDHPLVKQLFDNVASGKMTGRQAQQLASKLGRVAKTEMKSANGDRELGLALLKVKDIADDILAEGLPDAAASAFKTARGQYRILALMESANVTNTANGNVSLANLANLLARVDKNGYLRGHNQSDLYNAARFAQAFRPLVGDSGTATRSPFGTTIADIAVGIPVNIATRAYTSNTATAAAGAVARAAAGASQSAAPTARAVNNALAVAGQKAEPYLYPGAVNALYEQRR